jgi:hypothetical protein
MDPATNTNGAKVFPDPIPVPVSPLSQLMGEFALGLFSRLELLCIRIEALTAELKTQNQIEADKLEFSRLKDMLLATLNRRLKDRKKEKNNENEDSAAGKPGVQRPGQVLGEHDQGPQGNGSLDDSRSVGTVVQGGENK